MSDSRTPTQNGESATEITRAALFGKLNDVGYKSMESATVACKRRGNHYLDLAHWLHQLLEWPDSDLQCIVGRFGLDPLCLTGDLTKALDQLDGGAAAIRDIAPEIEETVRQGWSYASLMFGHSAIRTGHLLVAMLSDRRLRRVLEGRSSQFNKIDRAILVKEFLQITAGSPEEGLIAHDGTKIGGEAAPGKATDPMPPGVMGGREALKRFCVDLTGQARAGALDPIVGRDDEIRQIVDILMRRRQNNPILTGEAGVGKTAVVEGFAQRVVRGDVPPPLKDVSVLTLDVGLLQAGASMKGEFENRLRQVIEEVQSSRQPIILFIDEAHTLVGAGGAAGTGDAANLLKPALARGTLRTIAATTWAEYKRHIEKDPALTRRFQVVQVHEPGEDRAILMMRGLASTMEAHHRVQVLDEALEAAVRLSHRYIPARQLPDKAVSLIDTAAARVAISLHAVPAPIDNIRKSVEALTTEMGIISRESAVGIDTADRGSAVSEKLTEQRRTLSELESRWDQERQWVDELLELRRRLRNGHNAVEDTGSDLEREANRQSVAMKESTPTESTDAPLTEAEREVMLDRLRLVQAELELLQGDSPLILPIVDAQAVASVVGDWTGIPVGRMVKNEIATVLNLADALNQRVIGQRHALDTIARRIRTARAQLDNPAKPIGVFLLVGPSGVGKTETALALAESLYGGEQNLIAINMSEFQEAHTVSTLKGAPPGYVGYGEGGVLTEAVRRRPYSVVLLDEIEKAHPDVHEIFFQVFDKGQMEDGEGRMINFRNAVILLTSNVGSELIINLCRDPLLMPGPDAISKALRKPLLEVFPAALLGRTVTVPYVPLTDEILGDIVRLQLDRIKRRTEQNHRIPLSYDEAVVRLIVSRCTEVESGGRVIDNILTQTVLPTISEHLLTRMMEGKAAAKVDICVNEGEFSYRFD